MTLKPQPFDPNRLRLASSIIEGIAYARQHHPKADDEWIARFLSGWLGDYVNAAVLHGRRGAGNVR